MSTDPQDSLLEEALRQDFPSADAQARVRRRLLAAGVAVGNGMAVGSAAAAGAASGAGVASKALVMSWGVKLGVLAAVTVPAVGLLVEHQLNAPASSAPAALARQAPGPSPAARPALARDLAPHGPTAAPSSNAAERIPTSQRPTLNTAAALPVAAPAAAAAAPQPSRGSFEPAEPASPSRATSTLAEETRLLDAAFAELALGNTKHAAELIGEHERRFPQGLLLKERQRAKLRLSEISRGESEGGRE